MNVKFRNWLSVS